MANRKTITKASRRPLPAKPVVQIDWRNMNTPSNPAITRRFIRSILKEIDDEGAGDLFRFARNVVEWSRQRQAVVELARIKATCAIIPAIRVPASELIPVEMKAKPSKRRARP